MIALDEVLGIPFQLGGRGKEGTDCWGIVELGLAQEGIHLTDPWPQLAAEWHTKWDKAHEYVPNGWVSMPPTTEPLPLDVLVIAKHGYANHVALYVGDGLALHSCPGTGSHMVAFRALRKSLRAVWRRL